MLAVGIPQLYFFVVLAIYVGNRLMQTLEVFELFLKDMRHITSDVHNAPRKLSDGVMGVAANLLQFFLGRR
jgi:hypothetical protein